MLGSINGLEVYQNDVVVKRLSRYGANTENNKRDSECKKRGVIKTLSKKSRKRLAFIACNTQIKFKFITTLTYPKKFPSNGKKVKYNLKMFLQWASRMKIGKYIWFLEFQKRGAPHFHILHENEIDKQALSLVWYKIVNSRDAKHLKAGTNIQAVRKEDGAKRYAVKYALKTHQKIVPLDYQSVGRFWGTSKGVVPEPEYTIRVNRRELEQLLENWSQLERLGERALSLNTLYGASGTVMQNLIKSLQNIDELWTP